MIKRGKAAHSAQVPALASESVAIAHRPLLQSRWRAGGLTEESDWGIFAAQEQRLAQLRQPDSESET